MTDARRDAVDDAAAQQTDVVASSVQPVVKPLSPPRQLISSFKKKKVQVVLENRCCGKHEGFFRVTRLPTFCRIISHCKPLNRSDYFAM